ncbi:MAG TPA: glycosyltransferase family 4 protein [Methanothrix sp.]|nr:glycosyltransferase family 4 protein [Methanothrix sp.]
MEVIPIKVAIRQISGGSGVDIWAKNFYNQLSSNNDLVSLEIYPPYYQFFPYALKYKSNSTNKNSLEVVQSTTWNGYAFKTDQPLVVTSHLVVHDISYNKYKTFQQRLFHKLIFHYEELSLNKADKVVSVSEYSKHKLDDAFGYNDSIVIYNGVDINVFKPTPVKKIDYGFNDKTFILLFVGNLNKRKGIDLLYKIMRQLGDEFMLITTSGLSKNVQKTSDNIVTVGRVSERTLIDLYNICDAFLFPSRLEGLPLTVLEAMACAKPVIATNTSSIPELVENGKGGLLCNVDDVSDFVYKIKYGAEDRDTLSKMGLYNRKIISRDFTLEQMTQSYLELYRSLGL